MGRGGTHPYQEILRYETGGETTHTVGWRLRSLGYGAAQIPVPPGELKVIGQRVEIIRGESSLPQSELRLSHSAETPHSELRTPHLVEWFHNTPAGLEHGFTLPERPRMGSTGDPPVRSGDSPNEMGEDASANKDSSLRETAPLVPVSLSAEQAGESATRAGEPPAPLNFQARAGPLR